ncbi:MAG: A/G-specific adenine glycosylase [Chthoniobacteraceae bacterium]
MNIPQSQIQNPKSFRAQLTAWFRRQGRDLPWRRTTDPYAILVSEFMLQQTQVATVLPYYKRWLARFPDFASLAEASEADVLSCWQGLGYYSRARNLQRAAREVISRFEGVLPADPDKIATLPGVGKYTAGAVAAFAFDLPVPTIDGNIARVLARLHDFREPIDSSHGQKQIAKIATALLPKRGGRLYTSALMELGALVCAPRRPKCSCCPVRRHCSTTEPEKLPIKRPRAPIRPLDEPCVWICDGHRLVLEQQTGRRWRGLWKLPRLAEAPDAKPIYAASYAFTNHRVALRVFRSNNTRQPGPHQAWIAQKDLASLAITAPHRRAIEQLLSPRATSAR